MIEPFDLRGVILEYSCWDVQKQGSSNQQGFARAYVVQKDFESTPLPASRLGSHFPQTPALAGAVFSHHPLCCQCITPGQSFVSTDHNVANYFLRLSRHWIFMPKERQATAHLGYPVLFLPGQLSRAGGRGVVCNGYKKWSVDASKVPVR